MINFYTLALALASSGSVSIESCNVTGFVEEQRVARSEIMARARQLFGQSEEISQKKEALILRKIASQSGNGLRGIFDSNHNARTIDAKLESLNELSKIIDEQFEFLRKKQLLLSLDLEAFRSNCETANAPNP